MFHLLYELGQTVAELEFRRELHDLLKDPLVEEYSNIVEMLFDESGTFIEVAARQINRNERASLLYKKGPPNGFDATALSKFAEDSGKTTNRVRKSIAAIADGLAQENTELKSLLTAVGDELHSNQDAIAAKVNLATKQLELDVKNRGLLSVSIKQAGAFVRVCDLPEVARLLVSNSLASYGKIGDKEGESVGNARICCICVTRCETVFGNFSELKTYNLDKPGMIAGGYASEQTVNNFPVCPKCAATLSLGISSASTQLKHKMAGLSYLILPQCQELRVRRRFVELANEKRNRESLDQEDLNSLQEDEWQILDEIASNFGSEDRLSLKLVFFESDQQSWKIKAEIDQVLPSRISKVLEAKRFVERRGWRGERDFITMSIVREFAGGSFTNSRRDFLSHVDAIFSGKCLDTTWIMRSLVDRILLASKQDPSKSGYVVKRAFLLLDFYQQLSIVSTKKGSPMNSSLSEKSCYGKFVDANPNFFGSPRKRVAFLTGSLVQCVMNVQKQRLDRMPFAKKIRGMRITEAMLRRLIADSKEKLRAYEADQFPQIRDLLELISEQWVASANEPELSTDEATFLFTLGMSLEYHVRQEFGREV